MQVESRKLLRNPQKAKAEAEVAVVRNVVAANPRPAGSGWAVQVAAPNNPRATSFPRTSISRRTIVIAMPNILHPFPDIPIHIVQTPRIGLFLTNIMGRLTS